MCCTHECFLILFVCVYICVCVRVCVRVCSLEDIYIYIYLYTSGGICIYISVPTLSSKLSTWQGSTCLSPFGSEQWIAID